MPQYRAKYHWNAEEKRQCTVETAEKYFPKDAAPMGVTIFSSLDKVDANEFFQMEEITPEVEVKLYEVFPNSVDYIRKMLGK